jgi:hypothetical protein
MARTYERDMREAKEDAEAYEGAITVHEQAAERYEWGQLAAEIGIVIASIALLLANRFVWMVSVCLGIVCAGSLGYTFVGSQKDLAAAELKIKAALENVQKLEQDDEAIEVPPSQAGATPASVHGGK